LNPKNKEGVIGSFLIKNDAFAVDLAYNKIDINNSGLDSMDST